MYNKITELRNTHNGEDIWIICAGSSMNFINKSFFENKITIGVNQVYKHFPCKYVIGKDLGERTRFDETIKDLKDTNIKFLFSKYHAGHHTPTPGTAMDGSGYNLPEYAENFYVFDHNDNGKNKNEGGTLDLSIIGSDDKIIAIRSTTNSAVHVAAYMGAKNIIICGADHGTIDDKLYFDGYVEDHWQSASNWMGIMHWYNKLEFVPYQIRDKIREVYGCNIHSLNPFLNFGLEGHKYEKC